MSARARDVAGCQLATKHHLMVSCGVCDYVSPSVAPVDRAKLREGLIEEAADRARHKAYEHLMSISCAHPLHQEALDQEHPTCAGRDGGLTAHRQRVGCLCPCHDARIDVTQEVRVV